MRRSGLALLAALLLAVTPVARADEDLEEVLEKIDRGRYRSAARTLDEMVDAAPGAHAVRLARARLRIETGKYDAAEEDLEAVLAAGPDGRAAAEDALLDLLLLRGRADEAAALAARALASRTDAVHPKLALGRAHRLRGRRDEAREVLGGLLKRDNRNPHPDPRDRLGIAVATIHLAELVEDREINLSPTMKLLDRLTRDDPEFVDAYVVKGDLLVKWQKDVDARKEYKKALKVNRKHAEALRGMAESYAFRMNLVQAKRYVKRAAETNPNLEAVLCFRAGMKVSDYEYDAARKLLARALEVNPNSGEARSLLGAAAFVTGDLDGFEEQAKKALAFDPTNGSFYHVLAQILESHRRFEEAASWARKAFEIDPRNWAAAFTLGRNLLNIGRDEEAYEILDRAERLDPYPHIWRANYLELFDAALSKFIETKTEHFSLRIHAKEVRVLKDLMAELMEEAYRVLGEKYGHEVKPPVLVEVFHVHADFAARTVGMPGLGALGACFGRVITLDSPSARDPGTFAWASTAWHEFAHSVTLGLSRGRVPRWFTEGLSVYEEGCRGAHYERRMERDLFDAHHNGKIPKIAKFNAEFRGPRVMFAYYLGGLMCEYIVEAHGFATIPAMLRLYGQEKRNAAVFKEALGVSLDEFDAGFGGWVEKKIGSWKLRPRWDGDAIERFRGAIAKNPREFESQISLAEAFVQRGNVVDAGMALGRAIELDPDHPRVLIVKGHIAVRSHVAKKAREFFEQGLAHPEGEDYDARLALARYLELDGEIERALESFEIAKRDFPFGVGPGNPYRELAEIHQAEGDTDRMLAEKRALAHLIETEIDVRSELATWAEDGGDFEEAARYLEEILMIYPLSAELDLRYARVLRRQKRWDRAAMLYRMTIELAAEDRPDLADVHAELAEVEHMRGRLKEARIQAKHALEIDPEHEGAKAVLEKVD